MAPLGSHRPALTALVTCAKSAGLSSFTIWYCAAWLQRKLKDGNRSIERRAVAKVRTHLRRVSSIRHSHAVSMCAWPIGTQVVACIGSEEPFSRSSSEAACASTDSRVMPPAGIARTMAPSPLRRSFVRGSSALPCQRHRRRRSKRSANCQTGSSSVTSSAHSSRPGLRSPHRARTSGWSHQKVVAPSGRLHAASIHNSTRWPARPRPRSPQTSGAIGAVSW